MPEVPRRAHEKKELILGIVLGEGGRMNGNSVSLDPQNTFLGTLALS